MLQILFLSPLFLTLLWVSILFIIYIFSFRTELREIGKNIVLSFLTCRYSTPTDICIPLVHWGIQTHARRMQWSTHSYSSNRSLEWHFWQNEKEKHFFDAYLLLCSFDQLMHSASCCDCHCCLTVSSSWDVFTNCYCLPDYIVMRREKKCQCTLAACTLWESSC